VKYFISLNITINTIFNGSTFLKFILRLKDQKLCLVLRLKNRLIRWINRIFSIYQLLDQVQVSKPYLHPVLLQLNSILFYSILLMTLDPRKVFFNDYFISKWRANGFRDILSISGEFTNRISLIICIHHNWLNYFLINWCLNLTELSFFAQTSKRKPLALNKNRYLYKYTFISNISLTS
jgi:hypothetical protein